MKSIFSLVSMALISVISCNSPKKTESPQIDSGLLETPEPGRRIVLFAGRQVLRAFLLLCVMLIAMPAYENQKGEAPLKNMVERTSGVRIKNPPNRVKSVALSDTVKLELVWIPSGTFMMGSPKSEKGRQIDEIYHRVTISKGFWMSKYEITQVQWQAVMGDNPSDFPNGDNLIVKKATYFVAGNPSTFRGNSNLPVDSVSFNDAQYFIKRLNRKTRMTFRLPTEAEWEYACRAGTTTAFYFGNSLTSDMANFDGRYPYNGSKGVWRNKTTPVGSFKPNSFGLYDMHGNVWEWCRDWYGPYPSKPVIDPTGPESGEYRVLRGGCWFFDAKYVRSAYRDRGYPDKRVGLLGFRLVLPCHR